MGRMTEHLRSEGVTHGRDYELQGSDAKCSESSADVTSQMQNVNLSAEGPKSQSPNIPMGSLKSQPGDAKV